MASRSSPFRRPASPQTPTAYRASSPTSSRAQPSPLSSPSKLKQSYTASEEEQDNMIITPTRIHTDGGSLSRSHIEPPPALLSTRRSLHSSIQSDRPVAPAGDNLARLPPALLHSLRESFSVLDANSTGVIDPSSVAETLQSLGLSTNEMSQLFPAGRPQQLSLPQYLNSMADILVSISPPQELMNAFSAFDDDDSGQVDVADLKRALLTTQPEAGERPLTEKDIDEALKGFTGRRILGKSAAGISGVRGIGTPGLNRRTGDVFQYRDFVGNLTGGGLGIDSVQHTITTR